MSVVQPAPTSPFKFLSLFLIALGLFVLYLSALSVYRLFFHPLSKVPGPKLAALTQWVETYYECFKPHPGGRGGQFIWAYRDWHRRYGPIVRISPNEVHIQDAPFYETLYTQGRTQHKLKGYQHRFGNPHAAFSTPWHDLHRHRRAALNPFFSKQKISSHAPCIRSHALRLCDRLEKEMKPSGQPVTVNNVWGCFTSDVVVSYALERQYNFIVRPDFRAEFPEAMMGMGDVVHIAGHFPWLFTAIKMLPNRLLRTIQPHLGALTDFTNEMRVQISDILGARQHAHENGQAGKKTPRLDEEKASGSVFSALLDSDLPSAELSLERLQHEAISIIGAGLETTMRALSLATFHVADNPPVQQRLRAELAEAFPDPGDVPSWENLQRLPYLSACIEETLRLSYGITQRQPRMFPDPVFYEYSKGGPKYILPPGTIISMDIYAVSHDEDVFPDSFRYNPERWMGDKRTPDGRALSRYKIFFGHGSRSCLGRQMAYADLFIGLASFFRKFEVQLFETQRDAIDCYFDMIVPRPKPGTKGVRVLLK